MSCDLSIQELSILPIVFSNHKEKILSFNVPIRNYYDQFRINITNRSLSLSSLPILIRTSPHRLQSRLLTKFTLLSMGYNSKCYSQDCSFNCCNSQGNCPSATAQCKYYYTSESNSGLIAGLVIGVILSIAVIIAIACYCYRKKQAQNVLEQLRNKEHINTTLQQLNDPSKTIYSHQHHPQRYYTTDRAPNFTAQTLPHPIPQIPSGYVKVEELQLGFAGQNRPQYSDPPFTRQIEPPVVQNPIIVTML